jgi:two-component system chemotaxis sensor kinase CheA
LSLTAEHSGGEVLIVISDDGRGIDPQRVRAKAVERGLILPDCVLTQKETIELIFRPGFSTAETISSVSGRGVGMDVVKRVIDSMRGSIEVESEFGKGTRVNLRIPLTLAIIDGLTVRVGDETYVLPLDYVEECVEMPCDADDGQDRNHLLHVRGNIVPYIRMNDWLHLQRDCDKKKMHDHIIIVAVDGIRFGLLVDQVVGEHQTVIKSLGPVFRELEGFSGATIQGDGSMSLILDVKALAQQISKAK